MPRPWRHAFLSTYHHLRLGRVRKRPGPGGDRVSIWADQSVNSFDADRDGANDGPLYLTSYKNGKPVLDFKGSVPASDGWLEIPSLATTTDLRGGWTYLAVLELENTAQARHYLLSSEGGGDAQSSAFDLTLGNSNAEGLGFWQDGAFHDDGPILPQTGWIIVVLQTRFNRPNSNLPHRSECWAKYIDITTPANSEEVEGGFTADPLYFWEHGHRFFGDVKIGSDWAGGSNIMHGKLAELVAVEHPPAALVKDGQRDPPVRRDHLDGVMNYWVDKYAL